MDHLPILVRVLDILAEQDVDTDAVEAALEREFSGAELVMADAYAATLGWLYVVPDVDGVSGMRFLRGTADHYRRRLPAEPAPRRRWGLRQVG